MKKTLLLLCGLLGYVGGMRADVGDVFTAPAKAVKDGVESTVDMTFKVLTEEEGNYTVQVGIGGYSSYWAIDMGYKGNLTIPEYVEHEGCVYDVTYIATNAFKGCQISSVEIPNSIEDVGGYTFMDCPYLTSVNIGSGLKAIGHQMFHHSENLTYIIVDDNNPYLYSEENAVITKDTKILVAGCKSTIIPEDVLRIARLAFGCKVTSIYIPASVVEIEENAFFSRSELVNLEVAESNEVYYSKDNCIIEKESKKLLMAGIEVSTIPEEVTGITSWALTDSRVENFVVPENVKFVFISAFYGCNNMKSVISYAQTPPSNYSFYSTPYTIGNPFRESNYTNAILYVPAGCKKKYQAANFWQDFGRIVEMGDFDLTVTDAMMATMYLESSVVAPDDPNLLGLYTAREVVGEGKDKNLLLDKLTSEVIPANTPVLVFANPGTYHFSFAPTDELATEGVMKGVSEVTAVSDLEEDSKYSILTLGRGKTGGFIGFYKFTGENLKANTCYLAIENESTESVKLQFADGTETGIESLNANDNADKGVYDLSGRRVSNPVRGLYIVNGKKVVKK